MLQSVVKGDGLPFQPSWR